MGSLHRFEKRRRPSRRGQPWPQRPPPKHRRRSSYPSWGWLIGGTLVAGLLSYLALANVEISSPMMAVRHLAAFPNCDAARAVGLAPARRGQPGYYRRHDRDQDGLACEPWRGR